MEKISFDYDGTLDTQKGKELAKKYISEGIPVYIITARHVLHSGEVYTTAQKIGIPRNRIYFTGGRDKWHTVKRLNITRHYDNNLKQLDLITKNTNAEAVKLSAALNTVK
jgi:hydroxymethylpyrimidine pyrophosphatase-like HAD family hydrolase